jgi:dTDP-4-amino-4,6-dideoxygalactose transaminase
MIPAREVTPPAGRDTLHVSFARPDISEAEIGAVLETLRSGWLTTGPRVDEFERQFADYVGAPHAVAVSSCTAALHLSLLAVGVGRGSEVVTTPMTFCATVNAIIHCGATPVFADIDSETMNLDVQTVKRAITSRTRAILPVHFGGRPVDVSTFRALARHHGAHLIEDAAHALGAAIDGVQIGALGDLTCFSFYSTKNLTTGEGGMVTTASSEWASMIRVASRHGVSQSAWSRQHPDRAPDYDVVYPGFKYNMTDLQAAIGLQQLARSPELFSRREAVWCRYDEGLAELPLTRPAPPASGTSHARHLYTIFVDPERCGWSRDALQQRLRQRGVQTSIHFRPLHLHSYYAERFGLRRGLFPNAEFVADRTLSLPLSSTLTNGEVDHVISVVREALEADG